MVHIYADNIVDCGGTRYTDNVVLTAAHCAFGKLSEYKVYTNLHALSTKDTNKNVAVYGVKKFVVHPNYIKVRVAHNDVAIGFLDASTNPHKKYISLDSMDLGTSVGTTMKVLGWGEHRSKDGAPGRELLREVELDVQFPDVCYVQHAPIYHQFFYSTVKENGEFVDKLVDVPLIKDSEMYQWAKFDKEVEFCASKPGQYKSVTNHDSGGPIFLEKQNGELPVLTGIASWGECEGRRNCKPSVFVRITKYLGWIESSIQENSVIV